MLWIWAVPGALMLGFAWGLTRFLNRKYKRLRCPRRLLRSLRKPLRSPDNGPDIQSLRASSLRLTEHLLLLQRKLHHAPSLPVDEDGVPRILEPAHELVDEGIFTADGMLQALDSWPCPPTSCEVWCLPLAMGVAQSQRLNRVLRAMLADTAQPAKAQRLYRQLRRSRKAAVLLERTTLTAIGLAELDQLIRTNGFESLQNIWDEWLVTQELTVDLLQKHAAARRQQIANEVRTAASCFENLYNLNWLDVCHIGDSIHTLLEQDPSGIYPRMDAPSQLALRRQVEALARHTGLAETVIAQHALQLADRADVNASDAGVCYWFQEAEGLRRLHRALPTKKGRLYTRVILRDEWFRYGFLCVFGIASGFIFLQCRGPVLMLPFFALVTGAIGRWLLRFFPRRELPRIAEFPSKLRTLVVMPAVLHDPHEAVLMVQHLKTVAHAFPTGVDFLLLGDFAPSITPVTAGDISICEAAASAIDALQDNRLMYLHRGRTWDSARHSYAARLGRIGALTAVCRLIAEGECEDTLVLSTVDTGSLERRYDYVLALPPDVQPLPGMYEQLLGTMIHPHSSRVPIAKGWRGYTILTAEGHPCFHGAGLLRPDAFLEATDGMLPTHEGISALAGELAGWTAVSGAHARCLSTGDTHATQYTNALRGWQLLPWQLPLVQTPTGLVSNPLRYASRFRLRETLRQTLIPIGQGVLLLYSLLTESPLLIVLALLPLVISHAPRRKEDLLRVLCHLSLLPTAMVLPLRALYDALRHRNTPPPIATLSMWAQGISAALLTGLGIALPGLSLPMLALGLLFTCFPLAHRLLETPVASSNGIAADTRALLLNAASILWRDFDNDTMKGFLSSGTTATPRELTGALLACICAKELGSLSANAAAMRMSALAEKLHAFLLPENDTAQANPDAQDTALLLSALMTAAQALRIWLPELAREYHDLAMGFETLISAMDVSRLYDPAVGLFYAAANDEDHPRGHIQYFADEALLLSVAACAKGIIPPSHFDKLRRTHIRYGKHALPLSAHGTASEHLIPILFLPLPDADIAAFAHTLAVTEQNRQPNWAALLCLPYKPELAAALASIDIPAILPDAPWEQSLLLASLSHILADAPLRRFFCSIPEVEVVLPLLEPRSSPLTIPRQ